MALSKQEILGCSDLPTRTVQVEQWGGEVLIRTLNGVEREELEKRIQRFRSSSSVTAKSAVRAVAVVMAAVDEDGNALFSDSDTEALAKKSGAALDLLFDEILDLNGMTKRAAEELEKN